MYFLLYNLGYDGIIMEKYTDKEYAVKLFNKDKESKIGIDGVEFRYDGILLIDGEILMSDRWENETN